MKQAHAEGVATREKAIEEIEKDSLNDPAGDDGGDDEERGSKVRRWGVAPGTPETTFR